MGWSAPFDQSVIDGWKAYSKLGGFAARADKVRNNILATARSHGIEKTQTRITHMTDQELHDQIVSIIQDNGETVSGHGLVLDGAETVAQLIMNLLIDTDRSVKND